MMRMIIYWSRFVKVLIFGVVLWLGYLAMRLSGRLHLPVVTAFLLLGVAVGPSGLDLVSYRALYALRVIEPVALAFITFSVGEQLRMRDVLAPSRRSYVAVALETVLPIVLVTVLVGTEHW
jgi:NhaP-type Na+/H+ or K+/H+ antiporter